MTTTPATNPDSKAVLFGLFNRILIWSPIVGGIIHQVLMFFSTTNEWDRIWVVLDPPGHISPFASLEVGWWVVLTFMSAMLCLLTYSDRIRPHRLIFPFYAYLVFLLIFVKPV